MEHAKTLGIIGDQNPIEHGGGVVYFDENQEDIRMLYFQPWSCGDENVSVYDIIVEDDVFEDLSLSHDDISLLASFSGLDVIEIREAASSKNPLARAQVYELYGQHYGFQNVVVCDETSTVSKLEERFGEFVDSAHLDAGKSLSEILERINA